MNTAGESLLSLSHHISELTKRNSCERHNSGRSRMSHPISDAKSEEERRNAALRNASPFTAIETAALHRDGEQARLIDLVRQRQQHDYDEMSTLAWIQSTVYELWDSLSYNESSTNGRSVNINSHDNGRAVRFDRHEHYADIVNPYREEQAVVIRRKVQMQQNSSTAADKKSDDNDGILTAVNDNSREYEIANTTQRHIIVRTIVFACRQLLRLVQYSIHTIIDRLILSENNSQSSSSANDLQYYTIQFTTRDVTSSFILLYTWMKINAWLKCENEIVSALGLMLTFGIVFRRQLLCVVVEASMESTSSSSRDGMMTAVIQNPQQQITTQRRKEETSIRQTPTVTLQSIPFNNSHSNMINHQQHHQAIQLLQHKYHPNVTHAECQRFYVCVKHKEKEAAQRLESWLKWRSDCGLQLTVDDTDDANDVSSQDGGGDREYSSEFIRQDKTLWNEAARLAIQLDSQKGTITNSSNTLPQIMCSYEEQIYTNSTIQLSNNHTQTKPPRAKDASRIFHILPARIDLTLASAPTYSLACALYLDSRLNRSTTEKITLLCDVRGGRGWANPTPWSLLPFVQSTSSLLGKQYPERLRRFVLFPMPSAAAWIWSAAQKFLDPDTASKVVVVGEEKGRRGMPERMKDYFDEDSLRSVEERRKSLMAPVPVATSGKLSEECVRAMLSC
eukprot:scaffold155273_cov35-Cyclotella_meneghiniana.AAC.1